MRLLNLSHGGFCFKSYIEVSRKQRLSNARILSADAGVLLDYDSSGKARVSKMIR